ncbi:MAG: hypothetical protein AB7D03_01430 [Thiomicrospira sp.]
MSQQDSRNKPQHRAQTELKQCLRALENKKPYPSPPGIVLSEQTCRQLARHIQTLLRKQLH